MVHLYRGHHLKQREVRAVPRIEINITKDELDARKERIERARRFATTGRTPVLLMIDNRYYYEKINVCMQEVFNDPIKMLEAQLNGQKWLLENIKSDQWEIPVQSYSWFENVREASALGCEIEFPTPNQVWVKEPWIKTEDDLKRLEEIDVIHGGLHGRELQFREAMMRVAKDYPVRLGDGYEFYPAENIRLCADMDGPFTLAAELRGYQQLMLDLYERPEFVKRLVSIIADKEIEWVEFCKKENGDDGTIWLGDDYVQFLSPAMYEEFALPYEKRIRFHFGGYCAFHLCGRSEHLLPYLINELKINEFSGFGFQLNRRKVAELMGGKVVLVGNISPMNLLNGTRESVVTEIREALEVFAPTKGYILCDGADIPPGTPVGNINLMYEVAQEYYEATVRP